MRKIKRALNLIITILIMLNIDSGEAQTIEVSGSLIDSVSKAKLFYGTVFIKNKNDSLVKGILANEEGDFLFQDIIFSKGMYLSTSYLGYKEKKININFEKNTKIKIGEVLLVPVKSNLSEIVIEGTTNYIEKKFDRKVYKMDSEKISIARSVLDLLRILPGVVIDNDGNIRYKGANAIIYVDDQPLNFQFPTVEMIPVDKVDKIELIDAAMFTGGDGHSGIINIKFKQTNTNGISGMLSANLSTICFESADKSKAFLNLNYKNKKCTFFLNTSVENSFSTEKNINVKEINFSQTLYNQSINSSGDYQRQTNFNNIGFVYWPSSITKLYLSGGFYTLGYKSNFETDFLENKESNQQVINKYLNSECADDHQLYEGLNFSYWHKFDTLDTYIKIFGNLNIYDIQSLQTKVYHFSQLNTNAVDSIYDVRDLKSSKNYGASLNVFYNHSVSKVTRWNVSYNFTLGLKDTTSNEHYVFSKYSLPLSQFAVNTNQQHDLSWRIGTKIKKIKIDGGINILDYYINGNYLRYDIANQDTVIPLEKNYFKLLPSTTFTYEFNESNDLKLTLSKSSILPNFNKLSDFIDKNELYNWSSGNPELKPTDFYSIYLGYSYNKDKCNATTELFYNYTNNEIASLSIPLSSNLMIVRPENIARKSNIGIDLSYWRKLNKNFNFSLSSTIFYLLYDLSSLQNTAIQYNLPIGKLISNEFGYNVKFNAEYKFKDYYAMLYFNYYAQELTFIGYRQPWISSSVNVSKKLLDNKLRISLGINNIFDDMIQHGFYSNNFGIISNTTTTGSKYQRMYYFSVQYNFKQGDRGTKDYRIGG